MSNEIKSRPGGAGADGVGFDSPCSTVRHRDGGQRLRLPRHHPDRAGPRAAGQHRLGAESGLYLGAWASNVDFGDSFDADVEVDLYAGFSGGEDITWDVGFIYYGYPGESDADFQELYASVGYSFLTGKIWYSDEFGGFDND